MLPISNDKYHFPAPLWGTANLSAQCSGYLHVIVCTRICCYTHKWINSTPLLLGVCCPFSFLSRMLLSVVRRQFVICTIERVLSLNLCSSPTSLSQTRIAIFFAGTKVGWVISYLHKWQVYFYAYSDLKDYFFLIIFFC